METYFTSYFENVFSQLSREGLICRVRRKAVLKNFKTLIEAFVKTSDGTFNYQEGGTQLLNAILHAHDEQKIKNGNICILGKFHNVLYIAAKISFDYRLRDSSLVARLLSDIYSCEGTFERLLAGALFGTTVSHFLSGWKSDFHDQNENLQALIYFADHAREARLEFQTGKHLRRFLDVPMTSLSNATPLKIACQLPIPRFDIVHLLLRHGSVIQFDNEEGYINSSFNELYIMNDFLNDMLRTNRMVPHLKNLCRYQIRHTLWTYWNLPHGIYQLPIPDILKDYLDLKTYS